MNIENLLNIDEQHDIFTLLHYFTSLLYYLLLFYKLIILFTIILQACYIIYYYFTSLLYYLLLFYKFLFCLKLLSSSFRTFVLDDTRSEEHFSKNFLNDPPFRTFFKKFFNIFFDPFDLNTHRRKIFPQRFK